VRAHPPDFLVIGHVVQDLLPSTSLPSPAHGRGAGGEGTPPWRLGGAVSYATLLAQRFGLRAAALTSCAPDLPLADLLPGVDLHFVPSERTTQMRNEYAAGRRTQHAPQRAAPLTAEHLPDDWRNARIVLLGPVAGEIDASLAAAFSPRTLLAAGAQGWLREIGPDAAVRPVPPGAWNARPILEHLDALFLSDEDLPIDAPGAHPAVLDEWAALVDVLAFTRGYAGADVHWNNEWRRIDAVPANPTDLTGAGDVFAAAFLIRYAETHDAWTAARFAAAAASLVIEGEGVEGVPTRAMVEARLASVRT
jgi:sugar/nucleoside kinase (ribokinase family)